FPEDMMLEALKLAYDSMQPAIALIEDLRSKVGKPKAEVQFFLPSTEFQEQVSGLARSRVRDLLAAGLDKHALRDSLNEVRVEVEESLVDELSPEELAGYDFSEAIEGVVKEATRRR